MPANRTAALGAAATAVATALVTLLGAVENVAQAIVVCVALLAVGAVAVVFLIGSQRSEKLTATWTSPTVDVASAALVEDPDADDVPAEELPSDDEELTDPKAAAIHQELVGAPPEQTP